MIRLLRDDGVEILVNTTFIRSIDQIDGKTVLKLSGEEEIHVKNHPKDIIEKIKAYNIGLGSGEKEDPAGEK